MAEPRRNLDEIYAGLCDGMTYEAVTHTYPSLQKSKLMKACEPLRRR